MPFVALFHEATNEQLLATIGGAIDVALAYWMLGFLPLRKHVRTLAALFLGLGVLVGQVGVPFNDAELAHSLGFAGLVLILAEGGFTTKWSEIRSALPSAILLATAGVGASWGAGHIGSNSLAVNGTKSIPVSVATAGLAGRAVWTAPATVRGGWRRRR